MENGHIGQEKKMKESYKVINTKAGLKDAVRVLGKEKILAVDLEADSMFHFRDKVCLIQIAAKKINYLIDPLLIDSLSSLKPLFSDRNIKKIFHGADYDVRSLCRDFNIKIINLFDTELASRFMGERETALNTVLNKRFDIILDKKFQKKDWSQRPLPEEMLEYAAKDTRYLFMLTKSLEKELREKKRLSWVKEECELLSRVRHTPDNGKPLFLKFKGAGRLDRKRLAILEAMLEFRMKIAEKKDRPLFKIISNSALKKITMERPTSLKQLESLGALSKTQLSMYGRGLMKEIKKALQLPDEKLPVYPKKRRPALKAEVARRIKKLKAWRDKQAAVFDLEPSLLFNKAELGIIASANPKGIKNLERIETLRRWQVREFGRDIIGVLSS